LFLAHQHSPSVIFFVSCRLGFIISGRLRFIYPCGLRRKGAQVRQADAVMGTGEMTTRQRWR
jgi:hypothetical protein